MKKILNVLLAMFLILTCCAFAMAEEIVAPDVQQAQLIDLTLVVKAVIAVIASIVVYKVVPLIDAKMTNEQKAMMRAAVRTFVFAAEQIYGAGNGARKLDFVLDQLKQKGIQSNETF